MPQSSRAMRIRSASFGGIGRVVVLAQHLDVATERHDSDAVFGLAPLSSKQGSRQLDRPQADGDVEADVELLAFHATRLGCQEMPQFVHEDHESQARRPP